ncbi:MAG TPA: hypothetical protein VM912_00345, partial [Terriglobales bacterium]|nr:hypothetical protein [Terriglobales bacterium]
LGISLDEARKAIHITPHIPAAWNYFAIENLSAFGGKYDIVFRRTEGSLWFNVAGDQNPCTLDFSIALSKHANILGASLKNRKLPYKIEQTAQDQHVNVQLQAPRNISRVVDQVWQTLQINAAGDFGLAADADLPPLGSASGNLKIFHEEWSADRRQLTVKLSGLPGRKYDLRAYGAKIGSINGGELKQSASGNQVIEIAIPAANDNQKYVEHEIAIRF